MFCVNIIYQFINLFIFRKIKEILKKYSVKNNSLLQSELKKNYFISFLLQLIIESNLQKKKQLIRIHVNT